jgi:hypothetical protein
VRTFPRTESAEPEDNLQFPISIAHSVGRGGVNDAGEVRTIQQALNRFGPGLGGPVPKLDPDGKVGKFTIAAIENFQKKHLGFFDGRVDPNKKTIDKINQLAFTIFVSVDPKVIKKIYDDLLPTVLKCVLAADAALLAASSTFLLGGGGLQPGGPSVALVNKHFALDKNKKAAQDFELIRGIVRNMIALCHRNLGGSERTFAAAPGRFDFAKAFFSGVRALTFSNGVNMRGIVNKGKAQDGSEILIPADKIHITIPFRFITRDLQIITLIHEMGHYLGPADGNPDSIDDPPGGNSAQDIIAKLPPERKPRIAECYADFAFEALFKRDPFALAV